MLIPPEEMVELLRFASARKEQDYEARQMIAQLTEREKEVLSLLAEGLDADEIAQRLHISAKTERNHVARILAKLSGRTPCCRLWSSPHATAWWRSPSLRRRPGMEERHVGASILREPQIEAEASALQRSKRRSDCTRQAPIIDERAIMLFKDLKEHPFAGL